MGNDWNQVEQNIIINERFGINLQTTKTKKTQEGNNHLYYLIIWKGLVL